MSENKPTPAASVEEMLKKHIANYASEVLKFWQVILFADFSDNVSQKIIAAMTEYASQAVGEKDREIERLNKENDWMKSMLGKTI